MVNDTGSSLAAERLPIPLVETGSCAKKDTGTTVFSGTGSEVFRQRDDSARRTGTFAQIQGRVVARAGCRIADPEQANGEFTTREWCYPDGLTGYLGELVAGYEQIIPTFKGEKFIGEDDEAFSPGEEVVPGR